MDFKRIGVVGAGTMGCGIAELLAIKGLEVFLSDISTSKLEQSLKLFETN
ncbi:3-hydroxyacyl-CoA dehydrogenase NAD-binding domain-containing protein [Paenibacillus filicis]|uniref:3-hydroxyacyl-CoA dehydrogenase NAD-binding domain-containing protein n=1 Tax=Paenibacillus gyeongsangnamensis TaxID=3388067 RepID=A0ABT4QIM8_9BACL|nr:3-hydroxyacyl-CoA dehydrogenase NAD-binding domain-containing protein [Paenibacillus filicis]MCZ8516735.1 3-hydroxyacyl-CoA dehydrogenase NAD-binding domain-containing protein [Paenibacillus filicis]